MAFAERFEERRDEIRAYLVFLSGVEAVIRSGVPRLGTDGPSITTLQQRILGSSVYLQLYNLVEATVTGCLDAISVAAMTGSPVNPGDMSPPLRAEWVRHMARTHRGMGPERRLELALNLCEHVVSGLPIDPFPIEKGGGGNWDDEEIHRMASRLGLDLRISPAALAGVKAKVRDDRGALALIVHLRNGLAHGRLSFAECGQDDGASELEVLSERVFAYLTEVVTAFDSYVSLGLHLKPALRLEAPFLAS